MVVDRLTVKASAKQRLTDSVETALNLADGIVVLDFVDREDDHPHREQRFSENWPAPTATPGRRRPRTAVVLVQLARTGPARNAAAWASARRSTPNWWCPTRT